MKVTRTISSCPCEAFLPSDHDVTIGCCCALSYRFYARSTDSYYALLTETLSLVPESSRHHRRHLTLLSLVSDYSIWFAEWLLFIYILYSPHCIYTVYFLVKAADAPVRMGKLQTVPAPSLKKKTFTGMIFETASRQPIIPLNINKPFFVARVNVR